MAHLVFISGILSAGIAKPASQALVTTVARPINDSVHFNEALSPGSNKLSYGLSEKSDFAVLAFLGLIHGGIGVAEKHLRRNGFVIRFGKDCNSSAR
jgi:hypothetical protein